MNNNHEYITYEGGCHCGAVRFRLVVNQHQVYECNCSICRKKGFLHLIVPSDKFTLLRGAENLSTYTFNTHIAKHFFAVPVELILFIVPVLIGRMLVLTYVA